MSEATPLSTPLPSTVVGERLRLELWAAERLEEVHRLVERSRPTLSGFLPWAAAPQSLDQVDEVRLEMVRRWREGSEVTWTVLEEGEVRGMLGLHRRGGPDELEIGYWLDDQATGRGVMTDACAMATDVAFAVDRIDAVEIVHDLANVRSEGVPSRLGYARVAAFTSPPQAALESGVKVRWVVRREAWRERHPTSSILETS